MTTSSKHILYDARARWLKSAEDDSHTTLTNLNLQLYSEPNENLFSESSNIM
jgi:hypothetical protein